MLGRLTNYILRPLGFRLSKIPARNSSANNAIVKSSHPDFEDFHWSIIEKVRPYTMTSFERLYGLIESVRFITENNIPGDIVECGVWRGGSMMAIAETLKATGDTNRRLWMFDTYEGMTAPTESDKDLNNSSAANLLNAAEKNTGKENIWCYASIDDVRQNILSTGYDEHNIRFIKGRVEDTLAGTGNIPEQIALLRLDTDWYESTKTELERLFPKLSTGGFLIVDDYGHWQGSKKALDEYFSANGLSLFLNRMDYTGRIGRKIN